MPRHRKQKNRAARKSATAAADRERNRRAKDSFRCYYDGGGGEPGFYNPTPFPGNHLFCSTTTTPRLDHGYGHGHGPGRRNSDSDIYNKNPFFLRRTRSRSPLMGGVYRPRICMDDPDGVGGGGGGGGGGANHLRRMMENHNIKNKIYTANTTTKSKNNSNNSSSTATNRTQYQPQQQQQQQQQQHPQTDVRYRRYDRVIRDVYNQGNQLKEAIKIMLDGLAKLQPDPEEMEWEGTNLTYYVSDVSDIPPLVPKTEIIMRAPEEDVGMGGAESLDGKAAPESAGSSSVLGCGGGASVLGLGGTAGTETGRETGTEKETEMERAE